jgi:hypothetical protein
MKSLLIFHDEKVVVEEIVRAVNEEPIQRGPEFLRTLLVACQSLQASLRLGFKLLARTAALSWSVEHLLNNFDIGMQILARQRVT